MLSLLLFALSPVEAIEKLGGTAQADPTRAGAPILKIVLRGESVTDKALDLLAAFPELRELDLSDAMVTDAGLAKLRGLAQLESLDLSGTLVTEAGLKRLAGIRVVKRR